VEVPEAMRYLSSYLSNHWAPVASEWSSGIVPVGCALASRAAALWTVPVSAAADNQKTTAVDAAHWLSKRTANATAAVRMVCSTAHAQRTTRNHPSKPVLSALVAAVVPVWLAKQMCRRAS